MPPCHLHPRLFPFLILATLLLGSLWIWLSRVPTAAFPSQPASIPLAGHPAPDFSLTRLDGGALSLTELRGRPVVLNFWASWCGPCEAEMPELQKAFERYGDKGLVVLGVNQGELAPTVADFTRRLGLTFPIVLDTSLDVSQDYRINSLPTTLFIDRDGVIRDQVIGQMNTAILRQHLRSIYP